MKNKKTFLALGECMIEFSHQSKDTLKMGFAGDTLNTSVYLARYEDKTDVDVAYATAIGTDFYSDEMVTFWQSEGIQTQFVQRIPERLPGLYLIKTDETGERSFYFYRSQSAARLFFHKISEQTLNLILGAIDYLYFSAISLAIWNETSRNRLFDFIKIAKNKGIQIIFDSNYRPQLWENVPLAQSQTQKAYNLSDIYLPTFGDHHDLFGDASAEVLAKQFAKKQNPKEVAIKDGENGCWIAYQGEVQHVPVPQPPIKVVDTTAAGDSFNAGYLAARMQGLEPIEAAKQGHKLASQVIQFPGAIVPR